MNSVVWLRPIFALLFLTACSDDPDAETRVSTPDDGSKPEPSLPAEIDADGGSAGTGGSPRSSATNDVMVNIPAAGGSAGAAVDVEPPVSGGGGPGAVDAGAGGAGGALGGAGGALGGAGGSGGFSELPSDTPTRLDPVPPPNSSWSLPTGDPLNATRPVLTAITGGAVIAGSSADPATVGLDVFADGVVSEAFVARVDTEGMVLWSKPLLDAGLPREVGVDVNGDIVVVAPYMPGIATITNSSSLDDLYIGKLTADGEVLFERQVSLGLEHEGTTVYGMATGDDGSIYLAGMVAFTGGMQHPLIAKYGSAGEEEWVRVIDHSGSQGWANDVVVMPGGDIVLSGYFDETLNFGGDDITSLGMLSEFPTPNGFVARLTTDGEHVYSARFGGYELDGGTALATSGDDVILTGGLTGEAVVGGVTVAASSEGSSFVAKLDVSGAARWITLGSGPIGRRVATDPAGNIYLAGQLGGDVLVASYDSEGELVVEATVPGGGEVASYALAVDDAFGVWIGGTFTGNVDFGNDNVLESEEPGVFMVRLRRQVE